MAEEINNEEKLTGKVQFRADPETEKFFSEIFKKYPTAKEAGANIMRAYTLMEARETSSEIDELNTLHHFVGRIEELYISLAKNRNDLKDIINQKTIEFEMQKAQLALELREAKRDAEEQAKLAREQIADAEDLARKAHDDVQSEITDLKQDVHRADEARINAEKLAEMSAKALKSAEA